MIKAVFFDLDGTLLPMNEDEFIKIYFKLLAKRLMPLGYNPDDLIKVIWGGTNAMFNNDGCKTNEEVFWQYFLDFYGEDKIKSDRKIIDEFYTNEFKLTKNSCFENPLAREIVDYCKSKGLFIGLSTNPIFPKAGTLTRMSFVNLKEEDFDFVTNYVLGKYKINIPEEVSHIVKSKDGDIISEFFTAEQIDKFINFIY